MSTTTSTEIVRVPFHGTELLTVGVDDKPHIVLRPAIEALGIDYATQYTKLRARSWAVVGQRPTTGSDGKTYQMMTVDVRTFLMLLATVDERRVAEHVRPLLVAYQREVADVIESYWTKGAAARPGVTPGPQHEVPQTLAEALRLAADQLDRAEVAEATVAEQGKALDKARPKAAYVDTFVRGTDDACLLRVLAKQLGVGEKALRDYLHARRVIYRRPTGTRLSGRGGEAVEHQWLPYAGYEKWFVLRDQPEAPRDHNGQLRTTLYVSPVGKVRIRELLTTEDAALFPAPARGQRRLALPAPGPATKAAPPGGWNAGRSLDPDPYRS